VTFGDFKSFFYKETLPRLSGTYVCMYICTYIIVGVSRCVCLCVGWCDRND